MNLLVCCLDWFDLMMVMELFVDLLVVNFRFVCLVGYFGTWVDWWLLLCDCLGVVWRCYVVYLVW